ncbi:MAG: hypothetical protein EBZ49_01220 [Proteobacteria bacterium]|nr:hypothetical protein [Pseudomonadota bacterium]
MAENNPPFGNKLSNVIGVPVPQWLINQFRVRSEQNTVLSNRSNENLKYLANKTAWVRMVSSVNIEFSDMLYFQRYTPQESQQVGPIKLADKDSLAKNFVLFAGTSKYSKDQNGNFGYGLRSGLGGSYGMLGEDEVNRYGYQPMPGITSVTIETMGRMGSVRSATINFRVFDKMQLDIVDALYFKLGYTMFLEWANTYYYETPNSTELPNAAEPLLKSTEDLSIDPFQPGLTKEMLNCKINKNVAKSYGNYDAMLGVVTNFNFTRKEDGSYDCTVKLIGLGALAESIRINAANEFSKYLEGEITFLVQRENIRIEQERKKETEDEKKKLDAIDKERKEIEKEIQSAQTFEEILRQEIGVSDLNPYKYESSGFSGVVSEDYVFNDIWAIRKIQSSRDSPTIEGPYVISNINTKRGRITITTIDSITLTNGVNRIIQGVGKEKLRETLNGLLSEDNRPTYSIIYLGVQGKGYTISIQYRYLDNIEVSFDLRGLEHLISSEDRGKIISNVIYIKREKILDSLLNPNTVVYGESAKLNIENGIPEISFTFYPQTQELKSEILSSIANQLKLNYDGRTLLGSSRSDVSESVGNFTLFQNDLEEAVNRIASKFEVGITIRDSALISKIVLSNNVAEKSRETLERNKNQQLIDIENNRKRLLEDIKTQQEELPLIDLKEVQTAEVQKYSSAIETALRIIQIHCLNQVGAADSKRVIQVDLTKGSDSVKTRLFSDHGLFSKIYSDLFSQGSKIADLNLTELETADQASLFKFYAKYGFNNAILSGRNNNQEDLKKMVFDQNELLKAYVIPIQVSQDFSSGIVLERPVHIKLGTLLLLLNHLSLIYDKKEENSKNTTPLVYLDYNPNTNFCLTVPNHLSTNPIDFLIPFTGVKEDFTKIFDPSVLSELKQDTIFDPKKDDGKSQDIPQFVDEGAVYRGKIMNILIDIQYLLNTMKRFVSTDETHSVYLKSFLEAVLSDISKYTGNYNVFRLAYNDSGNCLYIVDDQLFDNKSDMVYRDTKTNRTEIPLYGKKSIAKNLEIRTDISTKLANMIAISANSTGKQADLSTDASSFGFINSNFTDRYIPIRGGVENTQTSNSGSQKQSEGNKDAAEIFNASIKSFYAAGDDKSVNISADAIPTATNYYISRMAKVKSETPASRASAIIPVSINFTTDGISALSLYETFTVDDELLPYTYSSTKKENDESKALKKVGFCVVGLTHTIESNQWNTSVKSNMIFLKDKTDYSGEARSIKRSNNASAETEQVEDIKTDIGSIRQTKSYTQFIRQPGVKEKVKEIADYLGVKENDLYIVFASESGFDSTIQNEKTKATGLIQFMPKTAASATLNTTVDELKNMPVVEQLEYVKKYYSTYRNKIKNVYDLYLVTFWPVGLGKSADYVFQTSKISAKTVSEQNPAIATLSGKKPGDPLTIGDFIKYVNKKIESITLT